MKEDRIGYRGLVVIVPTRNRSELAIRSIRSALDAPVGEVRVLVSDNSTEEGEIARLGEFCRGLDGDRVRYIRPERPLPMPQHWDWVLRRALELFDENHFGILTDRFVFRPSGLGELREVASRFDRHAIVYRFDSAFDHVRPIRLVRKPGTGQVLELGAGDVLRAASRMKWFEFVPVLLNCFVPRRCLEAVRGRFGDYCLSLAPDYGFGFRALAVEDSILLYDKSIAIQWALSRSNGFSFSRGVMTADSRDFLANLGGESLGLASPIAEIETACNGIAHEYVVARARAGGEKFPDLDLPDYMRTLFEEVSRMENPGLKEKYLAILAAHGFRGAPPAARAAPDAPRPEEPPRPLTRRVKELLSSEPTKPIWWLLYSRLGLRPPRWMQFEFRTPDQALEFAGKYPHPMVSGIDHIYEETGVDRAWLAEPPRCLHQVRRDRAEGRGRAAGGRPGPNREAS